jgi:hypothetical protein
MPEEIEKENPATPSQPEAPLPEPEDEDDSEKKTEEEKPVAPKRKWLPSIPIRIPKLSRRLLWISGLCAVVLIVLGGVWFTKDHWIRWGESIDLAGAPQRKLNQDRSIEEKLEPLFIPITSQEQQGITMIDFSVVWDGLASVRYKKMELEIRDAIFEHVKSLAQKDENLKDQAPFLEEDLGRIFRRALGVEDLKVKIKIIKQY